MAELSVGTLYQINKQLLSSDRFKPLTHMELAAAQKKFEDFFNMKCDSYGMLYCRERGDITVFHMYENQNPNPPAVAARECLGCCLDRGEVLSIEEQPDGNYEIWIRIEDEPFAYFLFPYDNAVIEC